ncbi:FKBP-type peptidyl-prolyl cis-trans isomerase [Chloroflexota bacterium]
MKEMTFYLSLVMLFVLIVTTALVGCGEATPEPTPTVVQTQPRILFSPSEFAFDTKVGENVQLTDTLHIAELGGATLNWTVSEDTDWISLWPTSGQSTGEVDEVLLTISVLEAGEYSATITISSDEAVNSPATIPVNLHVEPVIVGAKKGDTVTVHYTGMLDDGTVFDSSLEREPLEFTIGSGKVVPGFEEAIIGMQVGDKKTVTIPAEEAYGPHRDDRILLISREKLPEGLNPVVGQRLQLRLMDGRTVLVLVTEVREEEIVVDANHPLAGKDLTFEIELVDVDAESTASTHEDNP